MSPLNDALRLINTLSTEEKRTLRDYLAERLRDDEEVVPARTRLDMDAIAKTFTALREGFTEEDLDELEWAINSDYIEPIDPSDDV